MSSITELLNKVKIIESKIDDLRGALESIGTDKFLAKIEGTTGPAQDVYVYSKPATSIIVSEQQITTTDWWSDVLDLSNYGFKLFYVENTEDVSVFIDIYSLPSLDSTILIPVRVGAEIPSNDYRLLLWKDRHAAGRLKFYTQNPPTTGYVNCILASWTHL